MRELRSVCEHAPGVERTNLRKKIKQHGLSRAGRGAPPDAATDADE